MIRPRLPAVTHDYVSAGTRLQPCDCLIIRLSEREHFIFMNLKDDLQKYFSSWPAKAHSLLSGVGLLTANRAAQTCIKNERTEA